MELVQIIYDILIFGGGLLLLVVLFSFVLSRSKKEEMDDKMSKKTEFNNNIAPKIINHKKIASQFLPQQNQPIVYKIDSTTREVKIIRKPTVTKEEIQKKIKYEEKRSTGTNGNGRRYTIVNDVMNKSNYNVANM